jgi:hypothetical protein
MATDVGALFKKSGSSKRASHQNKKAPHRSERRRWGRVAFDTQELYNAWLDKVRELDAVLLEDGQHPEDFNDRVIAYETSTNGWIWSRPLSDGFRRLIIKF